MGRDGEDVPRLYVAPDGRSVAFDVATNDDDAVNEAWARWRRHEAAYRG